MVIAGGGGLRPDHRLIGGGTLSGSCGADVYPGGGGLRPDHRLIGGGTLTGSWGGAE